MRSFSKIFVTGLAAMLPVLFTIYIVIWMGTAAESMLGDVIKFFLPDQWYIPGLGLLAGIVLLFFVGILLRVWVVQRLFGIGERLLNRIPLVKAIYGSIRDLTMFFTAGKEEGFSQVVSVRLGDTNLKLLGLITREDFGDLPAEMAGNREIAVYLPLSYQIGGYTAILPRTAVQPVDMTVQEAMRFALTGGMKSRGDAHEDS